MPTSKRNAATQLHPARRFVAPRAIQRGTPLADVIGPQLVDLVAESFVAVAPRFDSARFRRAALDGLAPLGLMQRAARVADALEAELPADFAAVAELLIAALGPELEQCEGNGLAPFFYLPHSFVIARHGPSHFDAGLRACYELTKRFTAEFCIRPFLIAEQAKAIRTLRSWTGDASPHVRRLVSEGTRPRLPWGLRLKGLQVDPRAALALLEKLKDDAEPYVRRSVANHLGDVLKDNPAAAYEVCERWIAEAAALRERHPTRAAARLAIVRHALRHPDKKGDPRAAKLRRAARDRRATS